jgi:predicted S18 family serine protease
MAGKTTLTENLIFIIILGIVLAVTVGPVIWNHFKRGAVLSSGIEANARIVDVTDTGKRHNTNPVVNIRLIVTDAAGKEFNAEITLPVSPLKLTGYKPGVAVKVKYDPKKPENVAIMDVGAKGQ